MAVSSGRKRKDRGTEWYSVSVTTIKSWSLVLLIAAIGATVYLVAHSREEKNLRQRVVDVMDEVQQLMGRVQKEQRSFTSRSEYHSAKESFHTAQDRYNAGRYRDAMASAQRSRDLLQALLNDLSPGGAGLAQFISAQGDVEYRRSGTNEWQEARSHIPLRPGDSIRTADGGSAEITFADGTLYTVRPNTQLLVSALNVSSGKPAEQAIEMDYGWVDLSTHQVPSAVKTPSATAHVHEATEAFVSVDRTTSKGRFGAVRGLVDLASASGLTRQIRDQQQVVQQGAELSEAKPLIGAPQLLAPDDNFQIDAESGNRRVLLKWAPAAGARRYALQVSANHLFVGNVIDVENRTKTEATLEARGEGTFNWRVAGFGGDGLLGPWSEERSFRIPSLRGGAMAAGREAKDTTPPRLDLEDVKSYGNIFIVGGRSEPGARIEINGELVKSNADGSFTKTVQLSQGGWSFIEIQARDEAGNTTVRRHRVFVESSL
jgi:hypothetical protein